MRSLSQSTWAKTGRGVRDTERVACASARLQGVQAPTLAHCALARLTKAATSGPSSLSLPPSGIRPRMPGFFCCLTTLHVPLRCTR